MEARWVRSGLVAAAMIVSCCAAFAQSEVVAILNQVASEDPGGRLNIPASNCVLVNNVWDPTGTPEGFSQRILLEKQGGEMLPGWRWNAPGKRTTVLGMPEIVCGDKPWDAPQKLRPEFPFHPGEKRLHADFDVHLETHGRHNMAFSLWAVSKLPAIKQNISLEIMIWNVDAGVTYAATRTGTFRSGGTTYDVYVKNDQGVVTGPDPFTWKLVLFVARKPFLNGSVEFTPFVDYLLDRHLLARSDYLTSLELGTEVADGTGSVLVRKFDLTVR